MTDTPDALNPDSPAGAAFYAALLEDDPQELYENAPCAYLSTLPDGLIVNVNATFLAWTRYEREELVGMRRFQELFPPGDRIFYETHFAPLLRMQGKVRELALDITTKSGDRIPVLVNSVMRYAPSGEPMRIRTAVFDATERRAYERELVAARERAEASEARATTLARTLQSTFLPPAILDVPGLDVGGAYRPAGDGSEVGGDFYDVFETGRGNWAVVLGDVCGKGAGAAVITSLARYTVRAEALRTPYPSAVLAHLHEALVRYQPDKFCTAVLMVVDRTAEGVRLTLTSGGHQLPLCLRAGGTFETLGSTGTILGMIEMPILHDTSTLLREGDVVVLYTDGVTEARHEGEFFGEERLRDLVSKLAALDAQSTADGIVAAALEFQHGNARDDIAVVVLKVPAPSPA